MSLPQGLTIAEKRTAMCMTELRNDIYWNEEEEQKNGREAAILKQQEKDAVELSHWTATECPICHKMVQESSLYSNFGHMESLHPSNGGF